MRSIRAVRIAAITVVAALLLAAVAVAADAPTTRVSGSISPRNVGTRTPVTLKLNLGITHPADSRLRLTRVVVLFPKGSKQNGNLFPSCTAAALNRARGRLSVCPRGSKIGSGVATGTAVDIGVTSSGKMTLFNGPGGRSIVFNVSIINPAQINLSFQAPLKKLSGRYAYRLTANIPAGLQEILDGPIVVRSINTRTGAFRVVNGVRRGYIEAGPCPRSGRAPVHVDFGFSDGVTSRADSVIACS